MAALFLPRMVVLGVVEGWTAARLAGMILAFSGCLLLTRFVSLYAENANKVARGSVRMRLITAIQNKQFTTGYSHLEDPA